MQSVDIETTAISPIEPDWNVIQERYLDGDDLASIAEDHAITPKAISMRAWRYHWKAQQFKLLEKNKVEVEREVRGCLMVSVLREARMFQRMDPSANPIEADLWGKVRARCHDLASKLFGWERDPLDHARQIKAIDV